MKPRRWHHQKRQALDATLAQPVAHLHAALEARRLDVMECDGEWAHVRRR
jgi:hypothetical protein